MPRAQHWIILSPPAEYSFDRIAKQRGKIVDWDAGLCLEDNAMLSCMKPRDRVTFISAGPNAQCWVC